MAWRKTPFKIKPELWDEKKDSYELALLMGVTPNTVRIHARKFGLKYKMRKWGRGMKEAAEIKTDESKVIRELIKQWRRGDDGAGRELQNYGIKAMRMAE